MSDCGAGNNRIAGNSHFSLHETIFSGKNQEKDAIMSVSDLPAPCEVVDRACRKGSGQGTWAHQQEMQSVTRYCLAPLWQ